MNQQPSPIALALTNKEAAAVRAAWSDRGINLAALVDAFFVRAGLVPCDAPNGTESRGGWWDFDMRNTFTIYPYSNGISH